MKLIIKLLFVVLVLLKYNVFSQDKHPIKKKKVLFVVTSNGKVQSTGDRTGIWLEEFAAPYYLLREKGIDIIIASPNGGKSPVDPRSTLPAYGTDAVKRFLNDREAQNSLDHTIALNKIDPKNYDAVFYPGGHGPMWDIPDNRYSVRLIESIYNSGKPIAFVCHGPVALKNVKTKDGNLLIKDRKVTGYANTEEDAGQTRKFIPFLLEDMLKNAGANYVKAADWSPFIVTDGRLITGQNPASAAGVAEELAKELSASNKPLNHGK